MTAVAICIPTYNQAAYLERAVRSALAQTHPCEVWVSDDCSTDDTPEVMRRLLQDFPRIHYFRHQQNLGIKGNPSWIIKQPLCDHLVRLDSDDELSPQYVEKLLKILMAQPTAGYAHAAVREIGANGQERRLRLLARNSGFQSGEESLRASISGYKVAANICMFRRAALEQVDYYRDLNFAEDWDLAVRLADAGWGNCYVNELLASYRVWDTPVRSRRKLAEVEGCRRLIEESLIPAFARRNWNPAPIVKARHRLALSHAAYLRSHQSEDSELNELKFALCRLGDSPALRWKFRWIRTPLAHLFQIPAMLEAKARSMGKALLFKRA